MKKGEGEREGETEVLVVVVGEGLRDDEGEGLLMLLSRDPFWNWMMTRFVCCSDCHDMG